LKESASDLHPVALAAQVHHKLDAIHPFFDGNGRTARLVMNLVLFRYGYPPTVIMRVNRRQYYQVLMQADAERSQDLVNFVGRAVERSLTLYLEACISRTTPASLDDEWVRLAEAAEGTPYSQEYLSLLVRKGRLELSERGRIWYTTRWDVAAYRQSVES
jgi:Fic family protein